MNREEIAAIEKGEQINADVKLTVLAKLLQDFAKQCRFSITLDFEDYEKSKCDPYLIIDNDIGVGYTTTWNPVSQEYDMEPGYFLQSLTSIPATRVSPPEVDVSDLWKKVDNSDSEIVAHRIIIMMIGEMEILADDYLEDRQEYRRVHLSKKE